MGDLKLQLKKQSSENLKPSESRLRRNQPGSQEIGALFREKRLAAGLSEEKVASYLGDITADTLSRYESGEKPISLSHVYALSNCLNVSTASVIKLITKFYRR